MALHLQLASEHFTLHGFPIGWQFSMTLVHLFLHEIINLAGWKRGDTAFPYIMLKEVINLAGATAELANLCFDANKG